MKYTPRPWEVIGTRYNRYRVQANVPSWQSPLEHGIHVIAKTYGPGKMAEANACLIAAAPDLLEALKAARDHLDYCGYGDKWERECAQAKGLKAKIDAAIAKATGENGE